MRILVTGSQGFIGKALSERLTRDGHHVIESTHHLTEELLRKGEQVHHTVCDLRNVDETLALFKKFAPFDRVYHMAADIGGSEFLRRYPESNRNNTLMSTSIIYASHLYKVERVLIPSSINIYEQSSAYGTERCLVEFLSDIASNGVTDFFTPRLANVTGPGCPWQNGRERVVAALCRKVLKNEAIELHHKRDVQPRALLHIDDAVEGLITVLEEGEPKQTYDLGHSNLISVKQIMMMIEFMHGKKTNVSTSPDSEPLRSLSISSEMFWRTNERLNWHPEHPPGDAIAETYKWVASELDKGQGAGEK